MGELHFSLGPPPPAPASIDGTKHVDVSTKQAALNWRPGPLAEWTRDRAASAKVRTTAPVLGTTARVYQYDGGRPGHQDITALWRYDDRVLEFRAGVADIAAFKVLLAALKRVDIDTWLLAMPDSVVKTKDRSTVIARDAARRHGAAGLRSEHDQGREADEGPLPARRRRLGDRRLHVVQALVRRSRQR